MQRWLDTIKTDGQRNACLVLTKTLRSFALSRDKSIIWPPIDIKVTQSREVQNFYNADELARLDAAIVELIAEQPRRLMGFAALRLLLMTGARRGEILSLRWADVDLKAGVLQLERDKTSDNRRDILLCRGRGRGAGEPSAAIDVTVRVLRRLRGRTCAYIEKHFRDADRARRAAQGAHPRSAPLLRQRLDPRAATPSTSPASCSATGSRARLHAMRTWSMTSRVRRSTASLVP